MKNFNKILISIIFSLVIFSCTKDNLIDTGKANGNVNATMLGYFDRDTYNWDSLKVMIRHTNMEKIFDGTSEYGKDITFFGITNHSIRRYLLQYGYNRVTDIPQDECRNFILSSILNEKITLEQFIPGKKSSDPYNIIGEGGKKYKTLSGKELWIYTYRDHYNGVPNSGPLKIYIVSETTSKTTKVASCNINTLTGIVHSLDYNFTPGDF